MSAPGSSPVGDDVRFSVATHDEGRAMVVTVLGELDFSSGAALKSLYRTVVVTRAGSLSALEVDLQQADFIDSASLRELAHWQTPLARAGVRLELSMTPRQQRLMGLVTDYDGPQGPTG